MRNFVSLLCLLALASACHDPDTEPSLIEGRDDPLASALGAAQEHGQLWLGARVEVGPGSQARDAWSFEFTQTTSLRLETEPSPTGPNVDTVLSLYRQGARGTSTLVARNDDREDSQLSLLQRELPPGRYRVVVQRRRPARAPFVLAAWCSGVDCRAPVQPPSCVFGETLADLPGLVRLSTIQTLNVQGQLPDELLARQLVAAAAHTPVAPVRKAVALFRSVDAGLVRWFRAWDQVSAREFRGVEFELQGHAYGALFDASGSEPVARIDRGRFDACDVPVQRCVLGTTYHELRANPDYTLLSHEKITAANVNSLSDTQREQLLRAVQVAYEEAADVQAALESVDQNEVNLLQFAANGSTQRIVAYEYGAGDNSYGGVFETASPALVARINDGDLLECTLLETL